MNNLILISEIRSMSAYSNLTDEFIEEFTNFFDWRYISKYKKIDAAFYKKYKSKLYKEALLKNHRIPIALKCLF